MSKKLIKLLTICAIVVLVPLVVLGIALSVSFNKGVSLSIFEGGDSVIDEYTRSKIAIFIGNQEQEQTTIFVQKGTEVTITWEGEGYHFDGWFEGNESEVQGKKSVSENKSYTFTLYNNRVLTAIKSYVTYKLNVQENALSSNVQELSYKRDSGFQTYNLTRAGYTFKGFKYNNSLYIPNGLDYTCDGASLTAELVKSSDYQLDVVAVWECNYISLPYFRLCTVVEGTYSPIIKEGEGEAYDEKDFSFEFVDTAEGYDLQDNYFQKLFGNDKYYIDDDTNREVDMLQVVKCEVVVENDSGNIYRISGVTTFKELIDSLNASRQLHGKEALKLTDRIQMTFTFKLK